MGRIQTLTNELNATTSALEYTSIAGATMSTTVAHTGTRSLAISSLVSTTAQYGRYQFASSTINVSFIRGWFYVTTLPSAENAIILNNDQVNLTTPVTYLTLDNGGLLRLYDEDGVIGSPSSALSTGQWYCLEMKIDRSAASGSHIVEARINGSVFATASNRAVGAGVLIAHFGGNLKAEAQTTGLWYWDDLAFNDNSGSVQNSYPGLENVACLRPNAAGDINTFATQTGGTAGAANNYTRVNETPIDNTTSFNGSNTLNEEDLFNFDNGSIGANDTITCVQVSARMRNDTADAVTALKLEIEKAASGTKTQSSAIIINTTNSFSTNGGVVPVSPAITLYNDPDGSPWTPITIASLQAGYIISAGGTHRIDITAIWVVVSYIPYVAQNYTKSISDSLTITETVQKNETKVLSDSLVMSEIFAKGGYVQNFSDSLTIIESVVKSPSKFLNENLAISESFIKAGSKNLIDNLTISEALAKALTKILSESLTITDIKQKALTKNFGDGLTITEILLKSTTKGFNESLSISETLIKISTKNLNDNLTVTEVILKSNNKTVVESLSISESLIKLFTRNISESLTISEVLQKFRSKNFNDSLSVLDVLSKSITKSYNEFITIMETLVNTSQQRLSIVDTLTISEILTISRVKLLRIADSLKIKDAFHVLKNIVWYINDYGYFRKVNKAWNSLVNSSWFKKN